ncbi:unnamed protein product [Arctia plantaginis]|uniref:Uncharacterized protein n=1 Tax=Arctia plantaginis TaxID=874455 RepID=A0A8S1BR82_ARCPL|nr:unnamed protein product [Arctia plantaginis]
MGRVSLVTGGVRGHWCGAGVPRILWCGGVPEAREAVVWGGARVGGGDKAERRDGAVPGRLDGLLRGGRVHPTPRASPTVVRAAP